MIRLTRLFLSDWPLAPVLVLAAGLVVLLLELVMLMMPAVAADVFFFFVTPVVWGYVLLAGGYVAAQYFRHQTIKKN